MRRLLRAPLFKGTALLGSCVVVWSLFLVGLRRETMAVVFFATGVVALMAWVLFQLWRWPARVVMVEESIDLPHSCETVWNLIEPPENAPLCDPTVVRGYRVPGTPTGVGAQQAFVMVDDSTAVIEVVEFEPGRRAMTRVVSPPNPGGERTIEAVDPIEGGCRYTIAQQLDVQSGCRVFRAAETHWRTWARARLECTREVLAIGESTAGAEPT
jgi:hypothetical protein